MSAHTALHRHSPHGLSSSYALCQGVLRDKAEEGRKSMRQDTAGATRNKLLFSMHFPRPLVTLPFDGW